MAEKKTTATYDSIMRDLKAGNYAPVYILMGDESFYIDKITDYIANNVLDPDDRDFNQSIIFGADVTASEVADAAREYPVMPAQHRVVIVKEAQDLETLDALEKYMERPVPSTILVICHKNGTIDRRKKIVGKAEAVGIVFESKKKKDYELPNFITNYLKTKKADIDSRSAEIIAQSVGADLHRLISELDKLLIALPQDNRKVTPDLVEQQIGISKEYNVFELRDAIIEKDVLKANRIVNYFDKNPKAGSLYSFIPMLFNFFQNLMVAHYAPDKNNERALAAYLEQKNLWGVRSYLTGLRNYTARKTLQIIAKLREIDAKSKGIDNPSTSSGDLMRELIFYITH